jgi:hypothetical protein
MKYKIASDKTAALMTKGLRLGREALRRKKHSSLYFNNTNDIEVL